MSTVADTMDFTYTFPSGSNNGNVQKITNNIDWHRTQSFTYDSLNRISTAQTNADNQPAFQGDNSLQMCWAETFTYDPWGNLLTLGANTTTQSNYTGCTQESGFNYTGSIATNNRLAVSGFSYDAAGNMTASPGATYTYDAENHLITTHGVTYAYDGDSRRLTKSSGMMYWYGLNSDPLIETDLSNNLKAHYIFFNGQRVASENSSNSVDWYFADHLGTARLVFSLNGDDQSDFYPFGGERTMTTGAGNHYKFTGKERDAESGLDNFGARYNSSTTGRFISVDPKFASGRVADPQSWNRYTYTRNNPLRYVDPDGKDYLYVYNPKTNTATVTINIVLTGPAASKKLASDWQTNTNKKIGGEHQTSFGLTVDIKVNVTTDPKSLPSDGRNEMSIDPAAKKTEVSPSADGKNVNSGTAKPDDALDANVQTHETLHFGGLKDEYDKDTGQALPGEEGTLMGDPRNPESKFTQDEIDQLGRKVCDQSQACTNTNPKKPNG